MNKYWEGEPNAEIDTSKNVVKYWRSAGKLQISMPNWKDKDGKEKKGKTVTLNLDALRETDGAINILKMILNEIS
jgi:hypothetical protein